MLNKILEKQHEKSIKTQKANSPKKSSSPRRIKLSPKTVKRKMMATVLQREPGLIEKIKIESDIIPYIRENFKKRWPDFRTFKYSEEVFDYSNITNEYQIINMITKFNREKKQISK